MKPRHFSPGSWQTDFSWRFFQLPFMHSKEAHQSRLALMRFFYLCYAAGLVTMNSLSFPPASRKNFVFREPF
jgi:hypothetical protein